MTFNLPFHLTGMWGYLYRLLVILSLFTLSRDRRVSSLLLCPAPQEDSLPHTPPRFRQLPAQLPRLDPLQAPPTTRRRGKANHHQISISVSTSSPTDTVGFVRTQLGTFQFSCLDRGLGHLYFQCGATTECSSAQQTFQDRQGQALHEECQQVGCWLSSVSSS